MEISYDPRKDKLNKRKHGVSLSIAEFVDWDTAVVWPDQRYQYDELRENALALKGVTLYFISFVERGAVLRVISVRKATIEEVERYVRATS
ncbi:BrnT family toxin [Oxalobacteraceae bacterium A2-2]